jgi:hypothetical protein
MLMRDNIQGWHLARRIVAVWLLLAAASFGPAASASIIFGFSGTCNFDCARFGLANGTPFDEPGVITLLDGTDISAGADLQLSSFESFVFFGVDFLSGNTLLELATPSVGFTAEGVLNGFVINNSPAGGTNNFCYNFPGRSCQNGNFASEVDGQFSALNGPGQFGLAQVPVPAAAWLFGSALLGLVGIKRRKA